MAQNSTTNVSSAQLLYVATFDSGGLRWHNFGNSFQKALSIMSYFLSIMSVVDWKYCPQTVSSP